MAKEEDIKKSPLHDWHDGHGGRMIEFGGWLMPVQYSSILDEHTAVRERAGLFDISHMGQVMVSGPGAEAWLNTMFTNDIRILSPGDAHYTLMLNETGGVIDDLIVYRLEDKQFLLVINASQTASDIKWMNKWMDEHVKFEPLQERAGFAIQGPKAEAILDKVFTKELHFPKRNEIVVWPYTDDAPVLVSRTGYTGEDGFELFTTQDTALLLWEELIKAGKGLGMLPVGLGARDTLRLESGLPLYGHELDTSITPYEAGLSAFVNNDKPERYIGRDALREQKERGIPRKLLGFQATADSMPPPRSGYSLWLKDKNIGRVTSGCLSPSLKKGIGMALVDAEHASIGNNLEIEIREKRYPVQLTSKKQYPQKS